MNLQIGVKVIIKNSDNLYLLIQRSSHYEDMEESWDIPGGRIDPQEDLKAALTREVKEEIGADLTGTPHLLAAQDIFVPKKELHVVRLTYLVDMDIDTITLSHEHQGHRWFTLSELKQLSLEPYLSEVVAALT